MNVQKILAAGSTGTGFMTLYSYIMSEMKEKNFKEPEVLGMLIHRVMPGIKRNDSQVIGWSLHYAVGLLFSIVYVHLWQEGKIKPTFKNSLLLGGASGLLAIMVWQTTFKVHPAPPNLNFSRYYGQLFIAHLIFGVFAALGYNLSVEYAGR